MVLSYGKILEPEIEPEAREPQKKGDDFEHILKLSLKTFFWTVTLLSFLLALYVTFFPYPAMKYYTNVGLNVRALETSEAYVKLNEKKYSQNEPAYDSKFADALLSAVNLSIGLMEDSIDKSGYDAPKTKLYAEKAEKYIIKYKSYKSFAQRSALLDAYYTSQVSVSAPAKRHVDFYSFNNYLDCMRVRIMAVLRKDNEAFSYFIGTIPYPSIAAASSDTILDSAGTFNILTSYLKTKLSLLGWDNVPTYGGLARDTDIFANEVMPSAYDFVLLYSDREYAPSGESGTRYSAGKMPALGRIETVIDGYADYVVALSINSDKSTSLKNLYCAKSVTDFIYTINNCFHVMNCYSSLYNASAQELMKSIYEEWDAKIMLNGYTTLDDWYNTMLLSYAALF